jgi:Ice-binding-like/Bacterial Ig-like domain
MMREIKIWKMFWVALLLGMIALVTGCGREQSPAVLPIVVSTTPANLATAVPLNSVVTATFNLAMASATINGTTFTVTGPGTTPVPGVVTYAGVTATFTPSAPLAAGTVFTGTITTGAQSTRGIGLLADYIWTFSTVTQPQVTSTNPANGAINVPINQKITATFNEPMNAATILAPLTFTVKPFLGGPNVPGTVTYDAASDTAIFTPTANLSVTTKFTATITTAAQDPAGKALANDYVWTFMTGLVANATAPTVILTNPINLATNVPLNQKIAAIFSEAMDPATITAPLTFTVKPTLGGPNVTGTVTYNAASDTAIFSPTANLSASTQYTATISNAAKDLSGNALIAGPVPNPWTFTTGTLANSAGPTITLEFPANLATLVPIDTTVSATFSAPMDPATINTTTFLVTVTADGTPVTGTVTYNVASQVATFTPLLNLAINTQYTATVSPAAQDLSGNALVPGMVPNPWTFTTGPVAGGASPPTVNLGTAANFAVLATASTTSTGPVIINGDVGLAPGTSQGIPPAQVNGTIHVNDAIATQAQADLLSAYNDAAGRTANSQPLPGDMGGLTFTPGLYTNSTSVLISTDVTLDAQGNPNAVFIFQMGSTLTTAGSVILINGAQANNIFWVVGTSATLNGPIFEGTILADTSITQNAGVVVNGRLFAGSGPGGAGTVTVDGVSVNVPQP